MVSLVKLVDSPDGSTSAKACAALMNLCKSFESASDVMETGVFKRLLAIIKEAGLDPNNWRGNSVRPYAMLALMNLAQWDRTDIRQRLVR